LSPTMAARLKAGERLLAGILHPDYGVALEVPGPVRLSLLQDLA